LQELDGRAGRLGEISRKRKLSQLAGDADTERPHDGEKAEAGGTDSEDESVFEGFGGVELPITDIEYQEGSTATADDNDDDDGDNDSDKDNGDDDIANDRADARGGIGKTASEGSPRPKDGGILPYTDEDGMAALSPNR
jgi:hypothetical protein